MDYQQKAKDTGSFDESGYEIDHIFEHTKTQDDSDANLQALCKSCHSVKTRRFNSKMEPLSKREDLLAINFIKTSSSVIQISAPDPRMVRLQQARLERERLQL